LLSHRARSSALSVTGPALAADLVDEHGAAAPLVVNRRMKACPEIFADAMTRTIAPQEILFDAVTPDG
jgi:hypothetical protein